MSSDNEDEHMHDDEDDDEDHDMLDAGAEGIFDHGEHLQGLGWALLSV